jgi:hypothetical protein
MEDPLISLYAALLAQWGGGIVPAVGAIRFSTGWYDKDLDTPQITVTEVSTLDRPLELGYGTVRVDAVYQVDIWVTIQRATAEGPTLAKTYKWAMRQEVKRILKANVTGLGGTKLMILRDLGRSLDEPEATPPILRFSQNVAVIYDI